MQIIITTISLFIDESDDDDDLNDDKQSAKKYDTEILIQDQDWPCIAHGILCHKHGNMWQESNN